MISIGGKKIDSIGIEERLFIAKKNEKRLYLKMRIACHDQILQKIADRSFYNCCSIYIYIFC